MISPGARLGPTIISQVHVLCCKKDIYMFIINKLLTRAYLKGILIKEETRTRNMLAIHLVRNLYIIPFHK